MPALAPEICSERVAVECGCPIAEEAVGVEVSVPARKIVQSIPTQIMSHLTAAMSSA